VNKFPMGRIIALDEVSARGRVRGRREGVVSFVGNAEMRCGFSGHCECYDFVKSLGWIER